MSSNHSHGQRYPQPRRTERLQSQRERENTQRNDIDCTTAQPPSTTTSTSTTINLEQSLANQPRAIDDAPPKYTPPPSYTTATGARIAKMLRNSIRRSMRR